MTLEAASPPVWTSSLSAATVARLQTFLDLLRKWNRSINLVASASLDDAWNRHVLDSAQLFDLRGARCQHWADLGSGAGFPGLVVAVLALEQAPDLRVSLVESDQRKAEFLRVVSRETGVPLTVHASRIESLAPLGADIVSARALAPLPALCVLAHRHLSPTGRAVFLKGARAHEEILDARRTWGFDLQSFPSRTDPMASVLQLGGLHRV